MKQMRILGLFLIVFMFSQPVWALMPPMELDELAKDSDVIVVGEVIDVKDTGKKTENKCRVDVGKEATLRVDQWKKGQKTSPLTIKFERTNFKDGCVGSPDHVHYKGEKGTFYLSCGDDTLCVLTHWNGVKK